jgi:hypothetical protein
LSHEATGPYFAGIATRLVRAVVEGVEALPADADGTRFGLFSVFTIDSGPRARSNGHADPSSVRQDHSDNLNRWGGFPAPAFKRP